MNDTIREIEKEQCRDDLPEFGPGDTLRLQVQILEGERKKSQRIEGIVIKQDRKLGQRAVTLRSILSGVGVERTLLLDSPLVEKIEVTRRGKVRRAKLYYLRSKVGKATRVKEKRREAGEKK
jgi:large subunit ribosomal protein L19